MSDAAVHALDHHERLPALVFQTKSLNVGFLGSDCMFLAL